MSQFIKDFRKTNPQYNDMADDQLVSALHNKFYSDMDAEAFNQKIGYQSIAEEPLQAVEPQLEPAQPEAIQAEITPQQEVIEPQAQESSMLDMVGAKYKEISADPVPNALKGAAERAGDVGAGFLTSVNVAAEAAEQAMPMGGLVWDGGVLPSYKGPEEYQAYLQQGGKDILAETEESAKGLEAGYVPTHTWEEVKREFSEGGALSGSAWGEVVGYVGEQGVKSLPDMAAALLNLPAYIIARSGEIGEARAKNKGKEGTDLIDVVEAAPFAVGSALLERIGAKGITQAGAESFGKEALKKGFAEAAKRTAKAGGKAASKEAVTEAIQEGMIEYAGERLGTNAKMTLKESLDLAAAGAVAGGGMGGAAGTVSAGYKEATYDPEAELGKALGDFIDQSRFEIDQKAIAGQFDPANAQLEVRPEQQESTQGVVKLKPHTPLEVTGEFEGVQPQGEFVAGMPESTPAVYDIPDEPKAEAKPEEKAEPVEKGKAKGLAVVEAPIDEVILSSDVPQFKEGADASGVVEPLGGKFERTGVAPIQVWVREDGTKEVISGRHRLDLAKRSGEQTIPAQYHYESEGFDVEQAASLDAILNIREGQGKVKDYVEFIQATKPTEAEATAQGILARQTGKRAFTIADSGSDTLIASHRANQISDEAATHIARAAPKNDALQAVGVKAMQDGKTIIMAENLVKAVGSMATNKQQVSGDLFGFDDSAMKEAVELAKKVGKKQAEIQRTLTAVTGAAKNPELARKEGVDVKDPEAIKKRIKQLKTKKKAWESWHTNPKLMEQLKVKQPIESEAAKETDAKVEEPQSPVLELEQQTEADIKADEAKQAKAKQDDKAATDKVEADKQVDDFVLAGSDRTADQVEARGQGGLFDKSAEPKPEARELEDSTIPRYVITEFNTATDAVKWMEDGAVEPVFREIARAIKSKINPNISFEVLSERNGGILGDFDSNEQKIRIYRGYGDESTVIHELIHAAVFNTVSGRGNSSAQAAALRDLEYLHQDISVADKSNLSDAEKKVLKDGLSNTQELVTYSLTRADFQSVLKKLMSKKERKNLFSELAAVIKSILGIDGVSDYFIERAISVSSTIIEKSKSFEVGYSTSAIDSFEKTQAMISDSKATKENIASSFDDLISSKESVIKQLEAMTQKELVKFTKSPKAKADKADLVVAAYRGMLEAHTLVHYQAVEFNDSQSYEDQITEVVKKQTEEDVANYLAETSTQIGQKIKTPEVDKRMDEIADNPAPDMLKSERHAVVHAPGHNYVDLYRSTGIPSRKEVFTIEGRRINMPEEPQRIEPIMRQLVKIMGRRIYNGKIKGKSVQGFYRSDVGELRTARKNDVEILAHEMAHYLDLYSNVSLPNFKRLYKQAAFKDEVAALSYTDDKKLELLEGFAEFVRLWLTNSNEAKLRAPGFYDAFVKELARDRKLLNPMRDMQEAMHKFYFQGSDKLGQALIGRDEGVYGKFMDWTYRRDSLIRQETIDKFHAAREVEKELTGKLSDPVEGSAWKQFRIANGGYEGIAEYIMNYGTLEYAENGDLVRNGKSLYEILKPADTLKGKLKPEHKKDKPIDLLMRYFAGRRALELHRQGRENLIPKETAKTWTKMGATYPVFEEIFTEYQEFNTRMMDMYQQAGLLTPEARQTMEKVNKDYVPFNRLRDSLEEGKGGGAGFQRLKGGTANLEDILHNIQDGVTSNVKAALDSRAKQRLYQYIANHRDGAIWATKIAPDSKLVKTHLADMEKKIGEVLEASGVVIEGELDLSDPGLLNFWQHGVKPTLSESGNFIDTVLVNGKPQYFEVQDPLLQEMLLTMNGESYSSLMNGMFAVKNFFTRSITLGVEFTGANLVRDTIGATFISKNQFRPFIDSFKGMHSYLTKDQYFQDFMRSGGGYSSRLHGSTKAGKARQRVQIKDVGVGNRGQRMISAFDNLMSAFEYGTRIGEFRLAKKNGASDMDAAFAAREISTDFSVYGANHFLTGYIRTVPFLNAMIQSQDRVFREAFIKNKYGGNPTGLAMKAFLGLTVPTLLLWLINKDDEDYKEIPDHEKRTNWHVPLGNGRFMKVPRPYDVGFVYATMPELFFQYLEDDKGKEYAEGMTWTLLQMYGIDGVPAAAQGWWDITRNKKWTGAPVVPKGLADVSATNQYNSNTSETFIRLGQALGMSPIKAEHAFKAQTGYLGGYLLWGTEKLMWDEDKFGEIPDKDVSSNIFIKRFLTPETRPNNRSMEKFFDLKEESDRVTADFKAGIDIRRMIKGDTLTEFEKDDTFFGLSKGEKEVLFALNDSMNDLISIAYGKEGIKTQEHAIRYNPKLTGEQKRESLDKLWQQRNKMFTQYHTEATKALDKAKKVAKETGIEGSRNRTATEKDKS